MKKSFICLISGDAPDFGSFGRGDLRECEPEKVALHVERKAIIALEALSRDELVYWLVDRGINPPDKADKEELREILISGKIIKKKKKTEGGKI